MKKYLFALILIIAFPLIRGSVVSAHSLELTEENFDYDWYLEQHPDVLAAFGTDQDAIWNFYVTLGEPGGWYGRPSILSLVGRYSDQTLGILYNQADTICTTYSNATDRTRAVHDWICGYMDYDYSFSSYTVDAAIINKVGVCQGYAETFNLLAELCGINSEIVTGVADNGTGSGGHAWNKVIINNEEYYIDTTWDDFTQKHNYIAHDCFMITKEQMDWIHDGKIYHFVNGQPQGYY